MMCLGFAEIESAESNPRHMTKVLCALCVCVPINMLLIKCLKEELEYEKNMDNLNNWKGRK